MADDSGFNITVDSDGVKGTLKPFEWLDGQADRFSTDHLPFAPSPRDAYVAAANTLKGLLQGVGVPAEIHLPTIPLPAPAGGAGGAAVGTLSPERIMQDIVDGINAAESRLNDQNFVIASGSVAATLTLPLTNVTLTFNITPKPYN